MKVERIVMIVFTIIGMLFIAAIIWYLFTKYWDKSSTQSTQSVWPPENYMKYVGAQCPDYWLYYGKSGNDVQCKNKYSLPITQSTKSSCKNVKCFQDSDQGLAQFTYISKWPPSSSAAKATGGSVQERCKWKECCGYGNNVPSSWVGIDQYC